jgi:hypothetical protein
MLGRIVHYRLSDDDVDSIARRRAELAKLSAEAGVSFNAVEAGEVYPATVVACFDGDGSVNLQVHLDGVDAHWATSRAEGAEAGMWCWPARVQEASAVG